MTATNLTRNGLTDWLVQRLSAVILLAFIISILVFYLSNQPGLDYLTWRGYFSSWPMKIFTLIALLSLLGHMWVGLWTVITDYIKPFVLRVLSYTLLLGFVLVVLVWVGLLIFSL